MDQTMMPIAFERRVSRRLVRRVIRRHRDIGGFAREVPHERGYALPAEELDAEDRAELGAPPTGLVVLLAEDADDAEAARTRLELQIFSTWEDLRRRGHLPRSAIRERIHRVGTTEMAEVRAVLRAQRRLLPARRGEPRDGVTWSLFAAYWAELRVFDDERLANELPTLAARHDEIDRLLAADVPWPIPPLAPSPPSGHDAEPAAISPSPPIATRPEVRALAARLVQLDARGAQTAWAELLAEADDRRLVIDLKKACRDAEQPLARGDLLGFIASLGRRPLSHPLPELAPVRVVRHLARAHARVHPPDGRLGLALHALIAERERGLRDHLGPLLREVIAPAVGHGSAVESVALDKLVGELLDRLVAKGRLDFAMLRDAVASNQAKLADLGADRLLADPLLGADRALASRLEGVHRPAGARHAWRMRATTRGMTRASCQRAPRSHRRSSCGS